MKYLETIAIILGACGGFSGLIMLGLWFGDWIVKRDAAHDRAVLNEIIGRDDATGKAVTRADLLKDLNADYKRFSGNSHDRRVQRRAHGRQEKTPLS